MPALADPDPAVRVAVLEALLAARTPGLGARVTAWLGDPDPHVRHAATEALAREPSIEAVAALGRVLSDPDAAVRASAARALGVSGSARAVVSLLGRLDDSDPDVREAVVLALSRIGDKSAVVPLIGKIQDSRPNVRQGVATALGELGDPRAASALTLVLRDSDEVVRVAALDALGRLHAEEAVSTIVALLGDEHRPDVRKAAFDALAQIPSETGIDALVAALSDDDPRERSPVRAALVRAGARAVPKLTLCLEGQPSFNMADGCALSLGEMRAKGGALVIAAALRRGVVRPDAALRALALTGDSDALGPVLEYIGAGDAWVRRAAVDAVGRLLDPENPDGRAVEPIERAMSAAHGQRAETTALVVLLGKTGSPRTVPVLAAFARDATDPELRLAAVQALGMVGRAGQDAVLLESLSDERANIRLAAALALRKCAAAATANPLLDRFENAAGDDRGSIAVALRGPLAVTRDAAVVERVERLARATTGAVRDGFVEALGAVPGALGSASLERLLESLPDRGTRMKIAEAFAAHVEALPALATLLRDEDPSVRAAAAWSIGAVGGAANVAAIIALARDADGSVAANAVAALGRLGTHGAAVAPELCRALGDARPYVRGNALAGLAAMGARCAGDPERALLEGDASEIVRARAARLVASAKGSSPAEDHAALARCASEDPSADVALACDAPTSPREAARPVAVSVYVVPNGATSSEPEAPFALEFADGFVRLGLTDRRGSVYEAAAPAGAVRLGIPAPLLF
jgi:HEAT repeat protein